MSRNTLLLVATRPEWGELKKILPFNKQSASPLPFFTCDYKGSSLALAQIGIGHIRAAVQFEKLLKLEEIAHVIHIGFSGALTEQFKTGEIFMPQTIINSENRILNLEHNKMATHLNWATGTLFTSDTVLSTPTQKKEAAEKHKAQAVDMESFPIAEICENKKIPYLSLRAIWDPLDWNLSLMESAHPTTPEGEVKTLSVLKTAVFNPKLLMSLPKYQSATHMAGKSLAQAVMGLIA